MNKENLISTLNHFIEDLKVDLDDFEVVWNINSFGFLCTSDESMSESNSENSICFEADSGEKLQKANTDPCEIEISISFPEHIKIFKPRKSKELSFGLNIFPELSFNLLTKKFLRLKLFL
eukprot:GHVP01041519.1.p1 GENE.GHVP01041519.1~~GHVP01041519.1.p1  ORF type:complete len:120 (+),score=29.90 GHVP01041519.1:26-385(+)